MYPAFGPGETLIFFVRFILQHWLLCNFMM